jgi:nitroreductase
VTELGEVVRRRRMTRSFTAEPVPGELIDGLVDLASRAPSAGKTQGWHLIVLEGADTARFWSCTLPADERDGFPWPGLLRAPVIALPFADPAAYVERYRSAEKAATGLGAGAEAWPTPYWTVDASMSVMTLLLAAEDAGLGALLFAVFRGHDELLAELRVPDGLELLGAIALGWPDRSATRRGVSAARARRTPGEIIHRGGW